MSQPASFAFAAAGIMLLVATGLACTCFRGWPTRLHVEANKMARNELPSLAVQRLVGAGIRLGATVGCRIEDPFRSCFGASGDLELGTPGKQPQLLLIGDSHAWNLQYGLAMLLQERQLAGYAMTRPNTVMFHVHAEPAGHVLEWLARQPDVTGVVLASRWMDYAPGGSNPVQPPEAWDLQLEEFAKRLQAMRRTLFVLADIPGYDYAPSDIAARMKIIPPRQLEPGWSDHAQPAETYDRMQGAINRVLEDICRKTGAVFVPAHLALRKGERYISFDEQEGCCVPLYGDANHLTHAGSLLTARFFAPYLLPEAP
ncbi:MAG: SGNH hydrolase domain-containing protein [bacterium]